MSKYSIIILLFPAFANAQSVVMERLVAQGLATNRAMQQQDFNLEKNRAAIAQAKALFRPTLNFAATFTAAAGGRSLPFPIGDLLNPVYSSLNQLTGTQNFPQVKNIDVQFLPNNFQETKFKIAQPIFNPDLRHNLLIQRELGVNATLKKLQLAQEISGEIRAAYFQMLQAFEAEKIYQINLQLLDELIRLNQSLVKNNVATREVISTAEYEKSRVEQQIFSLRLAQKTAIAYLNFLINSDKLDTPIEVDSSILLASSNIYFLEKSIADARANRLEIRQLQQGERIQSEVINLQKDHAKLPSAYVGGEFGFQGFGYHFLDKQAYGLLQIGLNYQVFDSGQNKSKIQVAKLENAQIKLQIEDAIRGVELQVTQAFYQYESARNALISAEKGAKAAEESFKIVRAKYRQQQVLPIEMLDAQTRWTTAREQILLAKISILTAENALKTASGF